MGNEDANFEGDSFSTMQWTSGSSPFPSFTYARLDRGDACISKDGLICFWAERLARELPFRRKLKKEKKSQVNKGVFYAFFVFHMVVSVSFCNVCIWSFNKFLILPFLKDMYIYVCIYVFISAIGGDEDLEQNRVWGFKQ